MDPRGRVPKPFQQLEKPGRIRRRKTRRERNKALVSTHRPLARQDPSVSSRESSAALQDPIASAASKLVVITQGRLSREHRGLFNHEVKSLDVARLLNSSSLEPCTPLLPTKPSCSPVSVQEPAVQPRGKENRGPGGPPSSPELPVLGQLLEELQCQLSLPQAFPRRDLVQESRDAILRSLQGRHGCVPDLTMVLRGCQSPSPETEPRVPERQRRTPSDGNVPEHAPREGRQRTQQGTKRPNFAPPHTCTGSHRASLVSPPDHRLPLLPSVSSPSAAAWGPPTAFDMLKSIWLIATPPQPQPQPQPLSPLVPRTSALDWSPDPPAPLLSLSWVVSQRSPEAWSFPPMKLY
ncbi:proline-rich protein 19 [Mesocricetus auratus]|uniref:Proline-rich protein 19 n=1 Tax=Mesocricetus auratus TaxID=10036 RepID=A0ABM2WIE1_MESAU|nr:proline-rich protein 19 [Mesocricetus auratus]XP_040590598.1 proline-rich protein 19 [Mesocricetus auratus]XP_040590599.1 proline-rich protein 19 [Mesocricetus auratus]